MHTCSSCHYRNNRLYEKACFRNLSPSILVHTSHHLTYSNSILFRIFLFPIKFELIIILYQVYKKNEYLVNQISHGNSLLSFPWGVSLFQKLYFFIELLLTFNLLLLFWSKYHIDKNRFIIIINLFRLFPRFKFLEVLCNLFPLPFVQIQIFWFRFILPCYCFVIIITLFLII